MRRRKAGQAEPGAKGIPASHPAKGQPTPKDNIMSEAQPTGGAVDQRLLEILVCPVTKGPLRYDREKGELVSERARLAYPIRDGIPIMLPDEARKLSG
jgi:uncharacterized protein YbaR (Trm112 family)